MFIACVTTRSVEIAHTYMAMADLEEAVEKVGHEVEVKAQGAQGLESEITPGGLERTDTTIIASDIRIKDGNRFNDVPTPAVDVQEAVRDSDSIVKELMETLE